MRARLVRENRRGSCSSDTLACWAESLIYAGSSAFLVLIANQFPIYWYLSFIALVPLLYKLSCAGRIEAMKLGLVFGLCFFSVTFSNGLILTTTEHVAKFVCGVASCAMFGFMVGLARERYGFNPIIVSILWVGFELALIKVGLTHRPFELAEKSGPFLHGMTALFGFLFVSFVIVLINATWLLAMEAAVALFRCRRTSVSASETIRNFGSTAGYVPAELYLIPETRAPPTGAV